MPVDSTGKGQELMARMFQVHEEDVAELERMLPELLEQLVMRPEATPRQRTMFRKVQQIIVNIRWNYGPPREVESNGQGVNVMSDIVGKWGYSTNQEIYYGRFDTREEAVADAHKDASNGSHFWTGQFRAPMRPEDAFDAYNLYEKVLCQDDYDGDWSDCWPEATKEQDADLEERVRKVFGEWLDEHDLRPTFGLIESVTIEKHVVTHGGRRADGAARPTNGLG